MTRIAGGWVGKGKEQVAVRAGCMLGGNLVERGCLLFCHDLSVPGKQSELKDHCNVNVPVCHMKSQESLQGCHDCRPVGGAVGRR